MRDQEAVEAKAPTADKQEDERQELMVPMGAKAPKVTFEFGGMQAPSDDKQEFVFQELFEKSDRVATADEVFVAAPSLDQVPLEVPTVEFEATSPVVSAVFDVVVEGVPRKVAIYKPCAICAIPELPYSRRSPANLKTSCERW